MKVKSHNRRMRRALGLLTALAALAAGASSALAGPIVTVNPGWTAITSNTGNFTTPDGGNTITAPGNVSIPVGANLQTQYCNQYGGNTQLVGATVTRIRWHPTASDFRGVMRIQGPDGTDLNNNYLYNNITELEMQKDQHYDDAVTFNPRGQCFYGGILANATSTPTGFTPLVTNQIKSVDVEDLEGPATSGARTLPGTWFTGNDAVIWWTQSDNSFLRGNTYASIVGGGSVDLGDQGNGETGAWVPVGGLADGSQTICGTRNASSAVYWNPASSCTVFLLDRNDPAVPSIGLSPDTGGEWTNGNVTVATAATGDGTGSGWNRNQFSNDGGAWYDSAASFVRSAEGAVTLTSRAVDTAGRVSGASTARTITIDKTNPTAQVSVGSQATPGLVTLSKGATGDALSGLKKFEVHLGAADGPIVATNDAELTDIGGSAPAKNAGAVKFYLTATDNAGNTATAASATVRLDAIAPAVAMQAAPAGWIKDFDVTGAVDDRLSVTLSDNVADGLGPVEVQIRQGAAAGTWKNMTTYNQPGSPNLSQGQHLLNPSLAGLGLVDGTAEIRVVAHDPTFNSLLSTTPVQTVKIDAASPEASDISGWASAPTGTPGFYKVTLPTLTDATSGLAKVEVLVNSDPAGGQADAAFTPAGSVTDPSGTVAVTTEITGLTAGIHATRVRATDHAGNVFLTSGPVITLDTSLPTVSTPSISGTGVISFDLSDAGGFGACPVKIEINGPATNAAWQTMFEQAAGTVPSPFSYQLPMSGMANGDYQVRTSVCDAAGNNTVQTKTFSWTGGPNFSSPGVPNAPGGANGGNSSTVNNFVSTELKADGQLGTRVVNGKVLPVIRRIYNRTFVLRGHLQNPDGTPRTGEGVELRDSAGRYITGGRTDAQGNFAITARGSIGGVWTVNPVGQTGRDAAALLEVKPIAQVKMKFVKVKTGRKLVVNGKLVPSAGAYNKALQLEWRDQSGKWRPALNGRVAKNGTFKMVYQFRKPGGYKVQFRVSVPTDNGWPYLATYSRIVRLKVAYATESFQPRKGRPPGQRVGAPSAHPPLRNPTPVTRTPRTLMSTQAPAAPAKLTRTRSKRRPAVRAGSTIPTQLADMLRGVGDPKQQLALITAHHSPEVVKDLAYVVGRAQAEEFVQDAILRLFETHTPKPGAPYTSVEGYHRLRAALITYSTNKVIDHRRRVATRSEVLVAAMDDPETSQWLEREGGNLAIEAGDANLVANLDASALYDAMRRVDIRDAELVRMKLEGATFYDICGHLGVRSTNAAFKHYSRAVCAVQKILRHYGFGGYCNDYGEYLLLARQEVAATGRDSERPLTEMVGDERALEIRLHVYGDPNIPSDEGCYGCQHAGETHAVALHTFNPLIFLPAAGLVGAAKGAIAGAWGNITGWFGGLFGGGATGGATAGTGVVAKGAAVVVAATAAVGGTITIEHATHHQAPAKHPAKTLVVATQPRPTFTPPAARSSRPKETATAATTSKAPVKRHAPSAEAEFAPTPSPTPRRSSTSSRGGSPSGEFTP